MILTNYFRQLTLPWLLAVAVMALLTGTWYYTEMRTQRRVNIEQYVAALQMSVPAVLLSRDPALIRAQLNQLRFGSSLTVNAIAVLNSQHNVLAASDDASRFSSVKPQHDIKDVKVVEHDGELRVFSPLTRDDAQSSALLNTPPGGRYLQVIIEPDTAHSAWLIPLLLVAAIGLLFLKLLHTAFMAASSRLQTDVGLLAHKLSQLRQGQLKAKVDEDIVPELNPLRLAFNELAAQQRQLHQTAVEANIQAKEQLQQEHEQQQYVRQQLADVKHQLSLLQHATSARLANFRLLLSQHPDITDGALRQSLQSVTELMALECNPQFEKAEFIDLTKLTARLLAEHQPELASSSAEIQLIESETVISNKVQVPQECLLKLLSSVLRVTARVSAATELVLRLDLVCDEQQAELDISMTCNGDGIPLRIAQLLNTTDTRALQWHEADVGQVMLLRQQCKATLSVQSLDGLGSTIRLRMPVEIAEQKCRTYEHILLFDNSALLAERCKSLAALAQHVVGCADITELQKKSCQYAYDVAVIILPEPDELLQWQALNQTLPTHLPRRYYARAAELQIWQETLQQTVRQAPFCIADLLADTARAIKPRLLVVDDNTTNLAFIQVLLKSQPIVLELAATGAEALQQCQSQQFDVVLLDIQLPDMLGTEVAKLLRQLPGYQQLPILAFTAHALEHEISAFKAAGMNDVILKPLDASKLDQILYWCLDGKINHGVQ